MVLSEQLALWTARDVVSVRGNQHAPAGEVGAGLPVGAAAQRHDATAGEGTKGRALQRAAPVAGKRRSRLERDNRSRRGVVAKPPWQHSPISAKVQGIVA